MAWGQVITGRMKEKTKKRGLEKISLRRRGISIGTERSKKEAPKHRLCAVSMWTRRQGEGNAIISTVPHEKNILFTALAKKKKELLILCRSGDVFVMRGAEV